MKTFINFLKEELKTYKVSNAHHNINTNVKAASPKHARELATIENKKFAHRETEASLSWTKE